MAKINQMAYLTAKQVAQRAMILTVWGLSSYGLVKETLYGVVETEEEKLVLPWEEGRKYVTNLHYLTHLWAKKLKGVARSSDYYDIDLSDLAEEIVKSCKDCAMTRWNF